MDFFPRWSKLVEISCYPSSVFKPWVKSHRFCRYTSLWVVVLSGPLDSTFQDPPASTCNADWPWSCKAWPEAKWEHFTPTPTKPGQGNTGQQDLAQQSHQVTACWAPTATQGKDGINLGLCLFTWEDGGNIEEFCHCSLKMASSSGSWNSWQLQEMHFPQVEVNKITCFQ